jgi:hypothetical protein
MRMKFTGQASEGTTAIDSDDTALVLNSPSPTPANAPSSAEVATVPRVVLGSIASADLSQPDVITFDNLPDGTIVTDQFPGVSFTGAQVLTAGVDLNPNFPPVSNPNVVFDFLNGTITATFTTPVTSVGAFVTGNTSITETIFSGATMLGSVSTGGANFIGADTGLPPNIFLGISSFGITSAVFTDTGNSFTLDNFTFTPVPSPTPTNLRITDIIPFSDSGESVQNSEPSLAVNPVNGCWDLEQTCQSSGYGFEKLS